MVSDWREQRMDLQDGDDQDRRNRMTEATPTPTAPVELHETEAEAVAWLVCQRNGVQARSTGSEKHSSQSSAAQSAAACASWKGPSKAPSGVSTSQTWVTSLRVRV